MTSMGSGSCEVDYIPETQYPESPILGPFVDTPQRLNPNQSPAPTFVLRCTSNDTQRVDNVKQPMQVPSDQSCGATLAPPSTANKKKESEELVQSMEDAIKRALHAGDKE